MTFHYLAHDGIIHNGFWNYPYSFQLGSILLSLEHLDGGHSDIFREFCKTEACNRKWGQVPTLFRYPWIHDWSQDLPHGRDVCFYSLNFTTPTTTNTTNVEVIQFVNQGAFAKLSLCHSAPSEDVRRCVVWSKRYIFSDSNQANSHQLHYKSSHWEHVYHFCYSCKVVQKCWYSIKQRELSNEQLTCQQYL